MRLARPLAIALAAVAAVAIVGCSPAAEQTLLSEFFAASRLLDRNAMGKFATVSFEPNVQGIVTGYDITKISAETTRGGMLSKDVSISAVVKLPGGQIAQKLFVVTMQREPRAGGSSPWIITAITDVSPVAP